MFKSIKARVRSGSSQLKSGSVHGLDKLSKTGSKRSVSGDVSTGTPGSESLGQSGRNGYVDQKRSVSAPGSSKPQYQSKFGHTRSPGKTRKPPPPVGTGGDLTYSPVFSSKSFPPTNYDTFENGRSNRDSFGGGVHYIYDNAAYNTNEADFNIFAKPGGITPSSTRLVVQCLTSAFKESISQVGDTKVLQQVIKPNLHHFSKDEVQEVKRLVCKLFPYDGCTLKDQALKKVVRDSFGENVIRLTVALRVIWSSFPKGIIPWESYYKFIKWESQTGFPPESFHFRFSKFLPDRNYTFCTFAFLEFLLCILLQKNKLMLDKSIQMDLIFTAGATAFVRDPSYCSSVNEEMPPVIRSYYQRGSALHRLFVGYIRSLNHERKMTDVYLLDIFQIEQYPPRPYKARSAKALTLTIPKGNPNGNDFTSLINQAASAKKRFFSASTSFSRIENAFLDQFEEQTLRVIMTFFSESSNRYITTFDDGFDAELLQGASKRNKSHSRKVSDDDNMVATWLQMAKEQNGFDELLEVLENNHMPEGGTLALGAPAATLGPTSRKDRNEDPNSSVRIGKTDITEWIINSWKYEMFMSRVQNTLLIKLTKKVDECNWLVLSCEENVNMNPKAVPPPAKHPPIPKDRPQRLQHPRGIVRESAAPSLPSVKENVLMDLPLPALPSDVPVPVSTAGPRAEPVVEAPKVQENDPVGDHLSKPVKHHLKQPLKEFDRESARKSSQSNDTLIAKLNNVDIPSSASDTSYEKEGNRTARSSHNVLGDLLESCYSGGEVEALN